MFSSANFTQVLRLTLGTWVTLKFSVFGSSWSRVSGCFKGNTGRVRRNVGHPYCGFSKLCVPFRHLLFHLETRRSRTKSPPLATKLVPLSPRKRSVPGWSTSFRPPPKHGSHPLGPATRDARRATRDARRADGQTHRHLQADHQALALAPVGGEEVLRAAGIWATDLESPK